MIDFVKFLKDHKETINTAKTITGIWDALDYEDYQSEDFICACNVLRIILLSINKIPITVIATNYHSTESRLAFKVKMSYGLTTIAIFKCGYDVECKTIAQIGELLGKSVTSNLKGITVAEIQKFLSMTDITFE